MDNNATAKVNVNYYDINIYSCSGDYYYTVVQSVGQMICTVHGELGPLGLYLI